MGGDWRGGGEGATVGMGSGSVPYSVWTKSAQDEAGTSRYGARLFSFHFSAGDNSVRILPGMFNWWRGRVWMPPDGLPQHVYAEVFGQCRCACLQRRGTSR